MATLINKQLLGNEWINSAFLWGPNKSLAPLSQLFLLLYYDYWPESTSNCAREIMNQLINYNISGPALTFCIKQELIACFLNHISTINRSVIVFETEEYP